MTEQQFKELFEAHYAGVLAYGLRRVDADTARDVAAETFLVAWRRLDTPPQAPLSWLLAVARRVLANELRRRGRAERLVERMEQEILVGENYPEHDSHVRSGAVTRAMATLSKSDQELLKLIGWEQLDHDAAARVLGCSKVALKVRLHRARRRLHAALNSATPSVASTTSIPVSRNSNPESMPPQQEAHR